MSHTPGPWTVELDVTNNGDISVFAPEMLPVASIDVREYPEDTGGIPREVALANARLIASAPDLLQACKLLTAGLSAIFKRSGMATTEAELAAVTECRRILDLSRAAIAKAEARQ